LEGGVAGAVVVVAVIEREPWLSRTRGLARFAADDHDERLVRADHLAALRANRQRGGLAQLAWLWCLRCVYPGVQ